MRKSGIRALLSAVMAAGLLVSGQAWAAQRCAALSEQQVFDLEALKSELMVLSVTCHTDSQYNAFINRYRSTMATNEQLLAEYFRHTYGRRSQGEQDSYVTAMANEQARFGLKQGGDFCPRNMALFDEAMALESEQDLPLYAAAKSLFPPTLGACEAPVVAVTEHTTTRKTTRQTAK
jgi:hypothetical protein